MRTFYLFQIKEEYEDLYERHAENLYQIFEYLFHLKENQTYEIELFSQLTAPIDKNTWNRDLFIRYHQERVYSKWQTSHIINDLYKEEISMLTIKRSYMRIESNQNRSTFFTYLETKHLPFFVCDFENHDYFWLSDLKTLLRFF